MSQEHAVKNGQLTESGKEIIDIVARRYRNDPHMIASITDIPLHLVIEYLAKDVTLNMVFHEGMWRDDRNSIWTDNWNYEDEISFRWVMEISVHHNRERIKGI